MWTLSLQRERERDREKERERESVAEDLAKSSILC